MIAVSPADTEAVKPAIKQANDAGIPVIMVNLLEPQEDIEVASYIGFDNTQAAKVSAYAVLDYFGGPGVLGAGDKVEVKPDDYLDLAWWEKTYGDADKNAIKANGSIIEGIAGTFFSQARVDGFNEVVEQYPGIEILGNPIAADWNREKGVKATENFLSRYKPADMNFIWAASNEMGLGAIQALEAQAAQRRRRAEGAAGRQGLGLHQRRDARVHGRDPAGQADRRDAPRVPGVGLVRHRVRRPARLRPGGGDEDRHPSPHRLRGQRGPVLSAARAARDRLGDDQERLQGMTLLEARSVSKSYPGVQALAGVDLSVDAGEVHALLGQNGAGKSTLMKIVAGSVTPDQGELELDGASIPLGSPDHAREHGIGIVYQELSLVPQLSIGENVLLGRWKPSRFGRLIGWKETFAEARKHLDRVGFDGDPSRPVSEFGMAERQLVELAKALSTDVRVLLLDEPTSALSDREARRLFTIIHELTLHDVAVIYVSHRLQELVEISDRVTVLRDGKVVENVRTRDVDEAQLARMMVGRATTLMRPPATEERRSTATGAVALRATGIARRPRLKEIDLELMEGEIVTVFGLMGAGRSRLAKTLFGLEPATAGRLEVLGRERRISSPVDAIDAGMGYVGEDRQGGLVPKMSVAANITLASLDSVFKGPLMNFDYERAEARRQVDDLAIRVQPPSTRRSRRCPAATSRRWCSRAGRARARACCCSTIRRAASTSAPRRRCSASCAAAPRRAARSCT